MSYTFVQDITPVSFNNAPGTPYDLTLSASVGAGHTLIAWCQTGSGESGPTISDAQSDNFVAIGNVDSGGAGQIWAWYVLSAAGGSTTIVFTSQSKNMSRVYAAEYSGIGAYIGESTNYQNPASSGSNGIVSGNIDITTSGGLIWGMTINVQYGSLANAGTSPIAFTARTSGDVYQPEDGTTPSVGNQQATWGFSSGIVQLSIAAAFAPPSTTGVNTWLWT